MITSDYEKLVYLFGKLQGMSWGLLEDSDIMDNDRFIKHILTVIRQDNKWDEER